MKRIRFGASDLMVSPLGLGCMSMSGCYGAQDDDECVATIHAALDGGVNLLDTSSNYGKGHNHQIIARAIKGRRERYVIHSKLGTVRPDGKTQVAGSREHIRNSTEGALRRLGIDCLDAICISRVDPHIPVEDSVGFMAELVKEGKTRAIGISKGLTPELLDRAWKVHPVAAMQDEYSLFVREPEDRLLAAARSHGMAFMAFAPLGRGILAGLFGSRADIPAGDERLADDRYAPGNFEANAAMVRALSDMAAEKGVAVSALVLAWLMHQPGQVIPIPSSKSRKHLAQNMKALDLGLSAEDIARIDAICPAGAAGASNHERNRAGAPR
jgi:aryl-alcohol dehydrogenase-like predicted oxidoreductase